MMSENPGQRKVTLNFDKGVHKNGGMEILG